MFSIKELESDLFFLEEYRESVIRDISPSLNSLSDELMHRYNPKVKAELEKTYIELESETKKLLNEDKRKQYIRILKRYRNNVFCVVGVKMISEWLEYKVDKAINEDKLFFVHDNEDIILTYLIYINEKIIYLNKKKI